MRNVSGRKGFTLLELLVVIAIIGILAAVILASLNSARIKARDGHRAAQSQEILKALELYYSDNGQYPDSLGGADSWVNLNQTGPATRIGTVLSSGTYIPVLPTDPVYEYNASYDSYYYCSLSPFSYYILFVNIESDGDESRHCYISRGNTTGSACLSAITNPDPDLPACSTVI